MRKYCVLILTLVLLALLCATAFAENNDNKARPAPTKSPATGEKAVIIKENGKEAPRGEGEPSTEPKTEPTQNARRDDRKNANKLNEGVDAGNRLPSSTTGQSSESSAPLPPATWTGQLAEEQNRMKHRLDKLESDGPTMDNLGPLAYFTNPFIFTLSMLLFIAALGLHGLHIWRVGQTNRLLRQMWAQQKNAAITNRSMVPGRNSGVENLAEQVRQQGQGLSQFTNQLNQFQGDLAKRDREFSDAVQAVALTASWVGQFQLREAAADGGHISEAERATASALLERYKEPLRVNASRVEPLAQAMADLVEKLESQPQLPPELAARAQTLYQDIGRYDLWHAKVSEQLTALQRGSFARRSSMLQADQQRLIEQVQSGSISISEMVQRSRELINQHFPPGTSNNSNDASTVEGEAELKNKIVTAPDALMDWFDNFSQFQSQLATQAARATLDADSANTAAQIQRLAREALNKFDIQPEEIQVGRTSYDRRLHDMSLIRQSSQFPTNTVIEVLRCGFRRMSNGEVLRRPQVIVAGAAAG